MDTTLISLVLIDSMNDRTHDWDTDESLTYAIIGPASIVDEIGENKFSCLVGGRRCWDGNEYDDE